jgi:hypothetical protein
LALNPLEEKLRQLLNPSQAPIDKSSLKDQGAQILKALNIEDGFEIDDDTIDEEPDIEPEWCEECMREAEESGMEYTPDFYPEDGAWMCAHCSGYC